MGEKENEAECFRYPLIYMAFLLLGFGAWEFSIKLAKSQPRTYVSCCNRVHGVSTRLLG